MRKFGNMDDIRKELSGKTMLAEEYEEDLFSRISEIESENGTVAPLEKIDWIMIMLMLAASAMLLVYAITFK